MAGGSIELAGLTKRFGHGHAAAVDNIDLHVTSGEFFSLLGPSGCGKTTTLRLIAGFEQPTAGRILLDGVDVSAVPAHKRHVNTVFQSYALFPFLSAFDNVAFGLRHAGSPVMSCGAGLARRWTSCPCPHSPRGGRRSCPAGSSSGSPSREP